MCSSSAIPVAAVPNAAGSTGGQPRARSARTPRPWRAAPGQSASVFLGRRSAARLGARLFSDAVVFSTMLFLPSRSSSLALSSLFSYPSALRERQRGNHARLLGAEAGPVTSRLAPRPRPPHQPDRGAKSQAPVAPDRSARRARNMQSATAARADVRAQTAALAPGCHGSAVNVHGRSNPSSSCARRRSRRRPSRSPRRVLRQSALMRGTAARGRAPRNRSPLAPALGLPLSLGRSFVFASCSFILIFCYPSSSSLGARRSSKTVPRRPHATSPTRWAPGVGRAGVSARCGRGKPDVLTLPIGRTTRPGSEPLTLPVPDQTPRRPRPRPHRARAARRAVRAFGSVPRPQSCPTSRRALLRAGVHAVKYGRDGQVRLILESEVAGAARGTSRSSTGAPGSARRAATGPTTEPGRPGACTWSRRGRSSGALREGSTHFLVSRSTACYPVPRRAVRLDPPFANPRSKPPCVHPITRENMASPPGRSPLRATSSSLARPSACLPGASAARCGWWPPSRPPRLPPFPQVELRCFPLAGYWAPARWPLAACAIFPDRLARRAWLGFCPPPQRGGGLRLAAITQITGAWTPRVACNLLRARPTRRASSMHARGRADRRVRDHVGACRSSQRPRRGRRPPGELAIALPIFAGRQAGACCWSAARSCALYADASRCRMKPTRLRSTRDPLWPIQPSSRLSSSLFPPMRCLLLLSFLLVRPFSSYSSPSPVLHPPSPSLLLPFFPPSSPISSSLLCQSSPLSPPRLLFSLPPFSLTSSPLSLPC